MSRIVAAAALLAVAAAFVPARGASLPIQNDPLGPLLDVTDSWLDYQPASSFCVPLDGFDMYRAFRGDDGAPCPGDETMLLVTVETPILCAGCRRLFIDYSEIPANDPANGLFYAHGHVYFRMHSWNFTYTSDPTAHSPNVKNVTNDKAFAPEDSPQERLATMFDTYAISYVGDTARFHHNAVQGPYYIGPWYVNRSGVAVNGAYVDVDVAGAQDMRNPALNGIGYGAGFDAGEATCPHNLDDRYADGDGFYFGCTPHPGVSTTAIDPFGDPFGS